SPRGCLKSASPFETQSMPGLAKSSASSFLTSALWNSTPPFNGTGRVGSAAFAVRTETQRTQRKKRGGTEDTLCPILKGVVSADKDKGSEVSLLPFVVAPVHLQGTACIRHEIEGDVGIGRHAGAELRAENLATAVARGDVIEDVQRNRAPIHVAPES